MSKNTKLYKQGCEDAINGTVDMDMYLYYSDTDYQRGVEDTNEASLSGQLEEVLDVWR